MDYSTPTLGCQTKSDNQNISSFASYLFACQKAELWLFIDDNYDFQHKFFPMIENPSGTISPHLPKIFMYRVLVEEGARQYEEEFGQTGRFPEAVREALAQDYVDEFQNRQEK